MKRFQFRLQALLDVAQHRERSLQQDLMRAQTVDDEARRRLDGTMRLHAEWEQRIRSRQRGTLDAHELRNGLSAADAVRRRAAKERDALRAAERATEAARARLTEAARDRKSLERLRERSQDEHTREEQAQSVKLSDDVASVRAAGRRHQEQPDSAMTGVEA